MKSKRYWQKRAENISNYEFEKADNYKLKLEEEYKKALKSIQGDVEAFYSKFANDNKISIADARKTLNSNELKEFRMTLKEFIEKAKNNENLQWEKELNNLSEKVRITRLESLQAQINNTIENLYSNQTQDTTNLLKGIYSDTYYKNIFEISKGLGIAVNFAKIDDKSITKVLKEPWHEGNYSSRIWNNKRLLVKELQSNLVQAFIRGDSIDKTSKVIANKMNVVKGAARRLVNTESAYITSKATFDSYSGSGFVKQYEILATLDLHTSKICRDLDGKVFDLGEKEIGKNAPPFHPNCRSTTIPYFDDVIDEERISRDPVTGKAKYVSGDMKYEDWYKENVANNPKALAEEKKIQNKSTDKKQYEEYKKILGNEIPKSFDKFQELKYNNIESCEKIKQQYNDKLVVNSLNKIDIKVTEKISDNQFIVNNYNPKISEMTQHANDNLENKSDRANMTADKAQSFIDNAKLVIFDSQRKTVKFMAGSGYAVLNLDNKLVTAVPQKWRNKYNKYLKED